jgi:hypothetical protein
MTKGQPSSEPGVGLRLAQWHGHAMSRTRVSTTVDEDLLTEARRVAAAGSDAALLDSVAVLVDRLGRLSDDKMRGICAARSVAVDCR